MTIKTMVKTIVMAIKTIDMTIKTMVKTIVMTIKTIVMTIKTTVKTIVMKEALQKLHRSFAEASQKLFLKATIHRRVFLCKLESFAGAVNYLRISVS